MIVRIATEAQYRLSDDAVNRLNELDNQAVTAVEGGEEAAFTDLFNQMLQLVRSEGSTLGEDELEESDVIIPPPDLTFAEAQAEFTGDGLIRTSPIGMTAARLSVALVLLAAWPAGASAADPAVLKGTISGIKVPAAGGERAHVLALELERGLYSASAAVTAPNRYRLTVPAGKYGLIALSVKLGRALGPAVGAVGLAAGKTRTLALSTKPKPKKKKTKKCKGKGKKKKCRRKKRTRDAEASQVPEGFGDVAVSWPAIAVNTFTVHGGGAAEAQMSKGERDLMITDLIGSVGLGAPGCGREAGVVGREHLQEVLDEIARGKDPRFDPSTAPESGKLVKDNASVSGTVSFDDGQVTITATYVERDSGYTATATRTGPVGDYLALHDQVATELAQQICHPPQPTPSPTPTPTPAAVPAAYEGTFSGTMFNSSTGTSVTWSGGTLRWGNFRELGFPSGPPYQYDAEAGMATVTVNQPGSPSSCALDGTESVPMVNQNGGYGSLTVDPGDGPPYRLLLGFPPGSAVTATRSGCPDAMENGTTYEWSLFGTRAVAPEGQQTGSSGVLAGQAATNNQGEPAYTYSWSFSPAG